MVKNCSHCGNSFRPLNSRRKYCRTCTPARRVQAVKKFRKNNPEKAAEMRRRNYEEKERPRTAALVEEIITTFDLSTDKETLARNLLEQRKGVTLRALTHPKVDALLAQYSGY